MSRPSTMKRIITSEIAVTDQLLVQALDPQIVIDWAVNNLRSNLSGIYIGPQGGRYEFIGDMSGIHAWKDPLRQTTHYRASRTARYLRRDRYPTT